MKHQILKQGLHYYFSNKAGIASIGTYDSEIVQRINEKSNLQCESYFKFNKVRRGLQK